MGEYRGRRLGWGPWRRDWFSICSRHGRGEELGCRMCMTGHYVWRVNYNLNHFVYKRWPNLWRWWVNRPGSWTRKRLEGWFPGLKSGSKPPD
jgi:hypothetical protein